MSELHPSPACLPFYRQCKVIFSLSDWSELGSTFSAWFRRIALMRMGTGRGKSVRCRHRFHAGDKPKGTRMMMFQHCPQKQLHLHLLGPVLWSSHEGITMHTAGLILGPHSVPYCLQASVPYLINGIIMLDSQVSA